MAESSPMIVVVGNGMFGASATRHLAERGQRVVNVGAPSGPDIRSGVPSAWDEHAVYASHNDAARLTRRQDRSAEWAVASARAIDGYRDLEERSGISFFHDVGCLIVSRVGGDGINPDPTEIMDETGIDYLRFAAGDATWRDRWSAVAFPETHDVVFEDSPAGYIQPKRLIAAQNVLAERAGARLVSDTVTSVMRAGERYRVRTASGESHDADKVLVAAGAFSNFNELLPAQIDLRLKSEVIVLGEVSDADAQRLRRFPTVKYLIDPGDLEGIYMISPVRYDDGRSYIKMGANTRLDQWFTTLSDVQRWFATDTDPEYLPIYEPALRNLWPDMAFQSIRTQPCVITYTPDRVPCIQHLGGGLFVATGGNGAGAKGADAWGERAADLVAE